MACLVLCTSDRILKPCAYTHIPRRGCSTFLHSSFVWATASAMYEEKVPRSHILTPAQPSCPVYILDPAHCSLLDRPLPIRQVSPAKVNKASFPVFSLLHELVCTGLGATMDPTAYFTISVTCIRQPCSSTYSRGQYATRCPRRYHDALNKHYEEPASLDLPRHHRPVCLIGPRLEIPRAPSGAPSWYMGSSPTSVHQPSKAELRSCVARYPTKKQPLLHLLSTL